MPYTPPPDQPLFSVVQQANEVSQAIRDQQQADEERRQAMAGMLGDIAVRMSSTQQMR